MEDGYDDGLMADYVDDLERELATLRAENERLKSKVAELEGEVFDLSCEMREMGDYE